MKRYKEYTEFHLPTIDKEILDFWKQAQVFERSVTERQGAEAFVFYEGPPSANGMPGVHHVLARSIKDIFCRFQTMKGRLVHRKGGWDTHGLPIELAVEKKLGITKEDIGKSISIEAYNAECKKTVMEFKDRWDDLTQKMGYWVDLDNPYITYENNYIESVWHLLQRLYKKGLLYKGYTIQPYSPAAGTGLSSHEINQPGCYKNVKDTTVVAMFELNKDENFLNGYTPTFIEEEGYDSAKEIFLHVKNDIISSDHWNLPVYFLAWTTTPWTLPSNTALTVGEKIQYEFIKTQNPYHLDQTIIVILAKELVKKWFGDEKKFISSYITDYDQVKEKNPSKIPYASLGSTPGASLAGLSYAQLLPFGNPIQPLDAYTPAVDAFKVIVGDFVTTEDGTGIVHTAPSFGADDRKAAKANGIGTLTLVDTQGKFLDTVGEFSGRYVKNYKDEADYKEVDVDIAVKLKLEGKAFNVQKYEHNYPHCWRTDKPILYYPLDSWFVRVTADGVKDKMVGLNQTINWKPAATGEGRFGNWLKNAQDWNLSRSRYWGIPLPIWRTEDKQEEVCIGSVEELCGAVNDSIAAGFMQENPYAWKTTYEYADPNPMAASWVVGGTQTPPNFDLHRPYIDKIVLVSASGKPMYRETDLIDVWFDSGAMPYAQHHYPFENRDLFEDENGNFTNKWVADFIAEGVDQTRGWFYTLHAIATMCFDSVAYKAVISNGLVLDSAGRKMSKRWGNAVEPFNAISMYGADAVRWYMITNAQPWDDLRFSWTKIYTDSEGKTHTFDPEVLEKDKDFYKNMRLTSELSEGIIEVYRSLFGTLYHTYNFFATYANADGFENTQKPLPLEQRDELDRWIISLLNTLIKEVETDFSNYEPTQAGRKVSEFVDTHLSNWYVRLSRRRFWNKGDLNQTSAQELDKLSAYQTLHECLLAITKMMAPIAPFFADWMYRNLNPDASYEPHDSVHLALFPVSNPAYIDKELEERMDYAQRFASLVLSLRKKEKVRVRQPLQKMLIPVLNPDFQAQMEKVAGIILTEVNIKELEFIHDTSGLVKKRVRPNFKVLGKKLGADMKNAQTAIEAMTQADISSLETAGTYALQIGEKSYQIEPADVQITSEDIEGWMVANDGELVVALDMHISPELFAEGLARELVNRIQNMRKEQKLEVTDKIQLTIQPHASLEMTLEKFGAYICNETQATVFKKEILTEHVPEMELLEGLNIRVDVQKIG